MSTKQDDGTTFDPSRRRLCPDGSCIGLLDSDGRCTVCGTLGSDGTGATPTAGPRRSPEPEINEVPTSDAEQAFDPNRRLCPDEACIGVMGSDDQCSVCGRRG